MGQVGPTKLRTEPWTWPAAHLAERIARKDLSPVEVVDEVLGRLE